MACHGIVTKGEAIHSDRAAEVQQGRITPEERRKGGRKRFKELRKRGVSKDLAAQTAGSAHGPWRIANSPAPALALPNAYLDSLGLPAMVVGS